LANPTGKKTTIKSYSLGAEVGSTDLDLVKVVEEVAAQYVEEVVE
jgi:hypothetical protein